MFVLAATLRATSRKLAGALLWVALLGGVFAMHGLGAHGVGPTSDVPMVAMDHGSGAGYDAMPTSHPMPGGDHTGMVVLCLAFLIAAMVLVRLDRFHRRRSGMTVSLRRLEYVPRLAINHPPPRARFCVMRC